MIRPNRMKTGRGTAACTSRIAGYQLITRYGHVEAQVYVATPAHRDAVEFAETGIRGAMRVNERIRRTRRSAGRRGSKHVVGRKECGRLLAGCVVTVVPVERLDLDDVRAS